MRKSSCVLVVFSIIALLLTVQSGINLDPLQSTTESEISLDEYDCNESSESENMQFDK